MFHRPSKLARLKLPILPMPGFDFANPSPANMIGGLIFGSIGFVAFIYGKRLSLWRQMFLGLGLMVFPYFVEATLPLYAIGSVGSALLFVLRD